MIGAVMVVMIIRMMMKHNMRIWGDLDWLRMRWWTRQRGRSINMTAGLTTTMINMAQQLLTVIDAMLLRLLGGLLHMWVLGLILILCTGTIGKEVLLRIMGGML